MKYCHNHATAGHHGVRRTTASVRQRDWWPSIKSDIKLWCLRCDSCQRRNLRPGPGRAPLVQVPVGAPFDRIATDILSFTEETEMGNTCVLVISDYFTKWAEAFALPNHQAVTVAHIMVTDFYEIWSAQPNSL